MIRQLLTLCIGVLGTHTQGYNLLGLNYTSPHLTYRYCPQIYPQLTRLTDEVIEEVNRLDTFHISIDEKSNNTICNQPRDTRIGHYAYLKYNNDTNRTDMVFTNNLLTRGLETTLYNTILHEMTHAVGLDHTTSSGIMNYSLIINQGRIKNDDRRLYLSQDDIRGIREFYRQVVGNTTRCRKKQIINLLRDC